MTRAEKNRVRSLARYYRLRDQILAARKAAWKKTVLTPDQKQKRSDYQREWDARKKASEIARMMEAPIPIRMAMFAVLSERLEKIRLNQARYRARNRDKCRQSIRAWEARNPGKVKAKQLLWIAQNPEKRRAIVRRCYRKTVSTPQGRLASRIHSAIYQALREAKSGRRWESLVGYTTDDLRRHIESLFVSGMNWSKFMAGEIHIDHVIPKSKFTYQTPQDIEFKRCWALINLQPMWSTENIKKGNKLEAPTQIALGV